MVTGRSSSNPFRDRNPSSLNALEASVAFGDWGVVRSYPSRSELFQQGTPADDVYYVRKGMVKLVWGEAGGKQTILGLRRDGCLIGVPAVVTGEPCPTSAVTLVPSILERISPGRFTRFKVEKSTNSLIGWVKWLAARLARDYAEFSAD